MIRILLILLLMGIVELIKRWGWPINLVPALAVSLGVLFVWLIWLLVEGPPLRSPTISGIILGLAAVGLYSAIKHTIKEIKARLTK